MAAAADPRPRALTLQDNILCHSATLPLDRSQQSSPSARFTDEDVSVMTQEACFGFRGRPFQSAPQDELFVPLEPTVGAIEQLVQAAERGDGIGVVTAAPGAGKTVVCREVKARLEPKFATVLLASCSFPTRRAMLQSILFEMGCEYARLSEQETRLHLLQAAQAVMPARQGLVIIADEAHQLSPRLLEELRCLTNHVEKGQPLIRVLVSGQLALE